ncbi:MAG: hypothetical protein HY275_13115 [Gemmatimonadetes bacterium]|nr:hypothetical protein [Gemmatimonadota bacterium]
MSMSWRTALLTLAVAACSTGDAKEAPKGSGKDASILDRVRTAVVSEHAVAAGTRVHATLDQALSSRTNNPGEALRATVSADVTNKQGTVLIPAGSKVQLTIDKLEPGSDQIRPEGRLWLIVNSVTVHGKAVPVTATLEPIAHTMVGRGVTSDEALRVGAGTAIGAAAGQAIGKDPKSTIIGGVIGAAAGTAVAVRYAYHDVVVANGAIIIFTIDQPITVAAR